MSVTTPAQSIRPARSTCRMFGSSRQITHERDQPDGQVDEEDVVPAEGVGQEAADERPEDERDAEHEAEEALVLAALGGREQVADDREGDREERTRAEALEPSEQHELRTCPGCSPDSAEPMRKSVMPTMKIGLRPYRSESLP